MVSKIQAMAYFPDPEGPSVCFHQCQSHVDTKIGCMDRLISKHLDAPLFLTVSITSPYRRNFRPGDTDPRIIPPLQSVLAFWRDEAFRQASKDKVTVMINQLGLQFSRMTEGGRKAWWDSQRFDEVSPGGVGYECKPELGAHGALPIRDCEFASYGFINEGHAPRITPNEPLKFHSGKKKQNPDRERERRKAMADK